MSISTTSLSSSSSSSSRKRRQYVPDDGSRIWHQNRRSRRRRRRRPCFSSSCTFVACCVGIVGVHLVQLLSLHFLEHTYLRFANTADYNDANKTNMSMIHNMKFPWREQQQQSLNYYNNQLQRPTNDATASPRSSERNSPVLSREIHTVDPNENQHDNNDKNSVTERDRVSNAGGGGGMGSQNPLMHSRDVIKSEVQRWTTMMNDKPILIVGGSDGSGTRGFVDTLQDFLKVDFVVEDPRTLDVHGGIMFQGNGWPALIEKTFGTTHTVNYDFDDLPSDHNQSEYILTEVNAFLASLRSKHLSKKRWDLRMRTQRASRDGTHTGTNDIDGADDVAFAFKAPVALLALPVLAKAIGRRIKFIHVVRE
jgi:hypothetical protein